MDISCYGKIQKAREEKNGLIISEKDSINKCHFTGVKYKPKGWQYYNCQPLCSYINRQRKRIYYLDFAFFYALGNFLKKEKRSQKGDLRAEPHVCRYACDDALDVTDFFGK